MGVLTRIAAAAALIAAVNALGGCYTPRLRDCTVRCAEPNECATGQVCGADGMCAAPERAGRCLAPDGGPRGDAGTPEVGVSRDASASIDASPDAEARPDAAVTATLRVQISGRGSVVVEGIGICSSQKPQRGNCVYDITVGVAQRAFPLRIALHDVFDSWTSPMCRGQVAVCVFTPDGPTTIAAKFVHGGGP